MNKSKVLTIGIGLALLSACNDERPKPAYDPALAADLARLDGKMAACAAGKVVSLEAGVRADLVKAIKGDVKFNADARKAIVGALFEGADISNPVVAGAYDKFENCLRTVKF
ncbi:hypothetical protein K7H13_03375 [Qipengyuania citrea]|uniref:hypothetical protein n=1 Tax=Qipengyuania citrea TaxID=225971 RepID=UPI001E6588FA|nr:hypothetical protein [Qipengyuania citrea]MCD1589803.1 hypothetical protein [Qipengyuania citrea]